MANVTNFLDVMEPVVRQLYSEGKSFDEVTMKLAACLCDCNGCNHEDYVEEAREVVEMVAGRMVGDIRRWRFSTGKGGDKDE